MLKVVIGPPRSVCLLDLRPSPRSGKCMVSETALYREQGLSVILPGFPQIDAFFADTKHLIELGRDRRVEDPPTVSHNGFWCPVATSGIGHDNEVVPLVLCWGDGGEELHRGKIFKNGDHVDRPGVWKQMLFNIPEITAPVLVPPRGPEWHLKLSVRLSLGLLKTKELTVRGHDSATSRWADLDSHAQACSMDTVLSQQGILLEFADLVSHRKRRFAYPC
jgi:hypothetical protein